MRTQLQTKYNEFLTLVSSIFYKFGVSEIQIWDHGDNYKRGVWELRHLRGIFRKKPTWRYYMVGNDPRRRSKAHPPLTILVPQSAATSRGRVALEVNYDILQVMVTGQGVQ